MVSEHESSELDLMEDPNNKNSINPKGLSAVQEWNMHDKINVSKKTVSKKVDNKVTKHPGINIGAKATRRPQYFIFNIILILVRTHHVILIDSTITVGYVDENEHGYFRQSNKTLL